MAATQYFEQVQKIFIAFYQRPADPAGLKYWAQRVDAAGGDFGAVIDAFAASPEAVALYGAIDATTIGTVIDSLYMALFNTAPDVAGKAFYVDGFTAGTFTAGTIALAVLNGAQNDDLIAVENKVQVANEFTEQVDGRSMYDAYFGTGTSFNVTYEGDADAQAARDILKAVTFDAASVINPAQVTEVLKTQIADATDPIQGQTGGQTFTLTTSVDNIVGTAGNDTILAVAATAATANTLSVADQIDGGAGTDTLKLTIDTLTANSVPAASTKNVEIIEVRNVSGNAQTINGSNFIGNTSFVNNVSADRLDLTNVKTSSVTVQGNNTATLGATNIAVSATIGNAVVAAADSVTQAFTLNIAGGTKGTANIYVDDTNADWTAATVNSTGAANSVGGLNLSGLQATDATHTIKDLTINADSNLTTTGITGFDVTAGVTNTITVKGAAAKVSIGTLAAAIDVVDASGLTAGGLTATLGASTAIKFTGGAGNDVVTSAGVLLAAGAFVDAGAGTADRLVLTTGIDVATLATVVANKASAALYKGFEELQLTGITQDVSIFAGSTIGKLVLSGNTTVQNASAAQAANVQVLNSGTHNIGVKGATIVGQLDTVHITADDGVAGMAAGPIALGTPTLTGVETLQLTANDNVTITALTSAADLTSIKLDGAGTIGLTTAAVDLAANTMIDASAATGVVTIDAALAQGTALTGLAIKGSLTAVNNISDSLKADVITGGAANDVVTFTGGADTVKLGAGSDTFNFTTKAGVANLVTFQFASGDSVTKADGSVAAAAALGVTNDVITNIDGNAAGSQFALNTGVAAATAGAGTLQTSTTALNFVNGQAALVTLAHANDFYVVINGGGTSANVYQDTDGNGKIDAGEFAIHIVGTNITASDFGVVNGALAFAGVA